MFTGIINSIGTITSAEQRGDLRIVVACDFSNFKMGESIACNGACLTVVEILSSGFAAELSGETISCTAPRWNKGDKLNLERAMRLGDTLDGHMVSGHVDGVAILKNIEKSGDSHVLGLEAPDEALAKFIAEKGSVTLDGVSLTVNKVENRQFWVNIIPHTWQNTTLGARNPGDALNLEIDLIARYTARLLQK